ncbi:lysocardiolipin acyltransferase 1-like [Argonauta hians]
MTSGSAVCLGVTFSCLVFLSSMMGTLFLLTPVLPVTLFEPFWGRWLLDSLVLSWKLYVVALYEIVLGVKVSVAGFPGKRTEQSLIVMNHRTRLDWLFAYSFMLRCGSLQHLKIVLKSGLKKIPGAGWAMQCLVLIFLERKWTNDEVLLDRYLNYFKTLNYPTQVLLFPEGTDLTESTVKKSDAYAERHNLEKYKYVLHPKTTGFVYITEHLRRDNQMEAIWDLSIGYPINIPQDEIDIVMGNFPKEVHFYVRTFPNDTLPQTADDLILWCQDAWSTKENLLEQFYTEKFFRVELKPNPRGPYKARSELLVRTILYVVLIGWSILLFFMLYSFYYSSFVRWYCLFISIFYTVITTSYFGVDILQTKLLEWHKDKRC